LQAIQNSTFRDYEVIVFDQGSTDGSVNYILENFPSIKLIRNDKNLGPTLGRNNGAKFARGKYLVFLDDDTKVESTWLEELVKATQSNPPQTGIFGSLEAPYDSEAKYNGVHGVCDILGCSFGDHNGYKINKKHNFFETLEFAILVKRGAFEKVEGFDPRYFIAGGLDFCWRARLAGYEIVNVRSAVVHHANRLTKNILGPKKIYLLQRNQLTTLIKNYGITTMLFTLPILIAQLLLEAGLFYFIGKPNLTIMVVKALLWNLEHFKENWVLHLKTQKIRKITDKEIMSKMTKKNLKALKMLRLLEHANLSSSSLDAEEDQLNETRSILHL